MPTGINVEGWDKTPTIVKALLESRPTRLEKREEQNKQNSQNRPQVTNRGQ